VNEVPEQEWVEALQRGAVSRVVTQPSPPGIVICLEDGRDLVCIPDYDDDGPAWYIHPPDTPWSHTIRPAS
jgi:hypothetical protein